MALRSIPPKTSTGTGRPHRRPIHRPTIRIGVEPTIRRQINQIKKEGLFRPTIYKPTAPPPAEKRRREWKYVTKPYFSKIKEPFVDVFKEAQEVQIIIDLGGFSKDEISFGLKDGKYTIHGKHGDQEFKEEIDLPKGVDFDNVVESFKNNILGIVLPKKKTKRRRGKE